MADVDKSALPPHCPGCGAQDWVSRQTLGGSVVMNVDPEVDVDIEECVECGTVTYTLKAYFTVIR